MSRYYVSCELGEQSGRILLGTLHKEELTISEVRKFPNEPLQDKDSLQWNVPQLYHEIIEGLRATGLYDEPVDGVSCTSWGGDYLLFDPEGSLITPVYHPSDSRQRAAAGKALAKMPWETLYAETGIQRRPCNTLLQLAAESSKRLKHAAHLLPIADGLNFMLSGARVVEHSLASTTQLYNPTTAGWSDMLAEAVGLPRKLLPPLVEPGTELGRLRLDIAKETRLLEARVVASCSHEITAALAGLPIAGQERWGFIWPGSWTVMGTQLTQPMINDASREMGFTNEPGPAGTFSFHKRAVGLWLLEECQRFWEARDLALDWDLLGHLASSAPPFESLIDPMDPRFAEPGDMPLKIQAFCKETNQTVPRKPGPIFRCILESLALLYRKMFQEIEYLTGAEITRLYIMGGQTNSLLHHFIANSLQVPVAIAAPDSVAMGNVIFQALALKHLPSLERGREIIRRSFKLETIAPHASVWDIAFDRFIGLDPAAAAAETPA